MKARIVALATAALAACGGGAPSNGGTVPATAPAGVHQTSAVAARFVEGAPTLAATVNGIEQPLGTAVLSVNGASVASNFTYGWVTQFVPVPSGTISVKAFNSVGYSIGPFTTSVAAGKSYTIALVGTYPRYHLQAFEEPKSASGAALSVYNASTRFASRDFGTYRSSSCSGGGTGFKRLGSIRQGAVATVSLGAHIAGFGGYVGTGVKPMAGGSVTPCQANAFDSTNALPFENSGRLSLILLDPFSGGGVGPVIGLLDQ